MKGRVLTAVLREGGVLTAVLTRGGLTDRCTAWGWGWVGVLTAVLWEAGGEWAARDLGLKKVLLVEEEDDGRVDEPLVVADRVEQLHRLDHPVHLLVLRQHQVIR